ncbi:MAG: DUF937 domain-containing protein [Alphaproteobacteria bacterium]|nr:DUF937 domain-containing protein [Alphaproteobacteria bacterium]
MGLLDSIVGQVLGQGQQPNAGQGGIAGALMQVLANQAGPGSGGLAGLLDQLRGAGLGQLVNSWVGPGANQPISPQQLQSALGQDQVQNIAQQSGMEPQDFLTQLSQHLPRIVDQATPDGRVPDEGTMSV